MIVTLVRKQIDYPVATGEVRCQMGKFRATRGVRHNLSARYFGALDGLGRIYGSVDIDSGHRTPRIIVSVRRPYQRRRCELFVKRDYIWHMVHSVRGTKTEPWTYSGWKNIGWLPGNALDLCHAVGLLEASRVAF